MWQVRLTPRAEKALGRLDRPAARRIRAALTKLSARDDPAGACKALTGPLTGLWRHRVGDYRIVLDIHRGELTITVIDIGHRSTIYD